MHVPNEDADVLILAMQPLSQRAADDLSMQHNAKRVILVDLQDDLQEDAAAALPEGWRHVRRHELLDAQQVRREFLAMLDAWPRRTPADGKGFDDLFRQQAGDSVWWTTGPGAHRSQTPKSIFSHLRTLWLCDRAIDRFRPKLVVVSSRDRRMTAMLESRCERADCRFAPADGSARPAGSAWSGQSLWLIRSLVTLTAYPLWVLARSLLARALAGNPRETAQERKTPTVVITGWYPRHVRPNGRKLEVWYWQEVVDHLESGHLESGHRDLRVRFLLYTQKFPLSGIRKLFRPFYTGWSRLRKVERAGSIPQVHAALSAFFAALPGQWSALVRYRRLERSAVFRRSFEFAGADVSRLMVPLVRGSIAGMAKWAQTVGSMTASLRQMGNVKAVLVQEEFYPRGMQTIAAARQLGIPTVGVQHGANSPAHLVYTVPAGCVEGSPVPDYFCAYGEYGKEVLCRHGSYPSERIWVVGSPRFDHVVRKPGRGRDARELLGLPTEKFVAMVATEGYRWSEAPCRALFEAVRGLDDVLVCIKMHPKDNAAEKYKALARRCGANNVRYYADRFDDLLAACDVLIAPCSTTILEAMLLGKATICTNFSNEPDRYPYVADGGSLGAGTSEQLRIALEQVRSAGNDPTLALDRMKFLRRHLGPTSTGQGAATMAEMIARQFFEQEKLARSA